MPREKLFSITKKDLEIETFRAGGKGGQKQNKTETGVRIRHRASGAVGEARDSRSQARNRKAALERLVRSGKFRTFLSHKVHMLALGKTMDEIIDEQMTPDKIKVEVHNEEGRGEDYDDGE